MKNLTFYQLGGYYSKEQCERIKEKFTGKTFLDFQFQYGGVADNNTLTVFTDVETTEEDLKDMFIYSVLSSI